MKNLDGLVKIGEDIETTAADLKRSVTSAVEQIDTTKVQILSYLDNLDK